MSNKQETEIVMQEPSGTDSDRRHFLKMAGTGVVALGAVSILGTPSAMAQDMSNGADNFYKSDRVTLQKVTFRNLYSMNVAGNLFVPDNLDRNARHPAIVVGHPMGAVKEQSANLYAQKMAEQGFVTLTFDLSFWGESEGQPRQAVLPDVYVDDYSAAVDFLSTQPLVDRERIGVLGICAGGGFAVGAAKLDPRMKAIATVSMYNMGAVNRNGLRHSQSVEQREQLLADAASQRLVEFQGGQTPWAGGTPNQLTASSGAIDREFYDFYRTPRGEFTPASETVESSTHRKLSSETRFMSFYPFEDIETISPRPMLFISGDQAHSREFSEDAYRRAAQPKELYWVMGAGHVDLYDRTKLIPFGKLTTFFRTHLA